MRTWKLIVAATAVSVAVGAIAVVNTWAQPARAQPPAGAAKPKAKHPVPKGYVLTHEHPTNPMAFGGNYAFTGAPGNYRNGIMERGYTAACSGCKALSGCDHGEFKGFFVETQVAGDIGDHKAHKGPLHDAFSHARYSTEWIREAWKPSEPELQDTRMRIFVAFAVENEAMCEQLYYVNKGKGGPGGDGFPCSHGDSLASMERQVTALKAWARENSAWAEIAYNASDARRIADADKLVVILGIESEYSFAAEDRTFDPIERLRRYYDLGVRTFYLAHKINSRLAGADIYWPGFTNEGKAIRATQAISGCFYFDDSIAPFPLRNDLGQNFCDNNCGAGYFKGFKGAGLLDNCARKFSDISEINMADYVALRGDGTFNGFKVYPVPPGFRGPGGTHMDGDIERNRLGLSHDGERVVREAMLKGMIVNIDHVSSQSRRDIHAVSKDFGGYPLNALHNNPNRMIVGNKGDLHTAFPHEYDFDDAELEIVRTTGGFFGVRVGPVDADDNLANGSGVTKNCPKTATETAKILAYLIDKGLDVGYGLDYATVTQAVWSRTLANCGRELGGGTDRFHKYGNEIAEGLSHIGMMKLFHDELEAVGLRKQYVDKLRADGAEAFVRMWEKSEDRSKVGKQIPRQTFGAGNGRNCGKDSDCGPSEYCTAGIPALNTKSCEAKKTHGALCTDKRQCKTDRCSWGFCADADECRSSTDCGSGQYCGDPISGKRTCKELKGHGQGCTDKSQCQSNRCSWGFCADADECRSNADCASSQYCGDPISGKRACKALKGHGQLCTDKSQCQSDRCSWGFCADADECRSNSDCNSNQYCGDPIGAKASCKALHGDGDGCTKGEQCRSKKCVLFKCK
jgi:microsomal dipeptidase-like Zn-dependent dipeptidase